METLGVVLYAVTKFKFKIHPYSSGRGWYLASRRRGGELRNWLLRHELRTLSSPHKPSFLTAPTKKKIRNISPLLSSPPLPLTLFTSPLLACHSLRPPPSPPHGPLPNPRHVIVLYPDHLVRLVPFSRRLLVVGRNLRLPVPALIAIRIHVCGILLAVVVVVNVPDPRAAAGKLVRHPRIAKPDGLLEEVRHCAPARGGRVVGLVAVHAVAESRRVLFRRIKSINRFSIVLVASSLSLRLLQLFNGRGEERKEKKEKKRGVKRCVIRTSGNAPEITSASTATRDSPRRCSSSLSTLGYFARRSWNAGARSGRIFVGRDEEVPSVFRFGADIVRSL